MKKNKKLFFLFITTLVVSTIFVFVVLTNQKHLPSATIGTTIEPLNGYLVTDIKQEKILLNRKFKNEKFIINIFSSWCVPCREEHKYLLKLKNNNIKVVGINYKDNKRNMSIFLKELGNPYYAIVNDKDGYQSIKLGAFGVPETFIIDENKKIVLKQIGPIDDSVYYKFLKVIAE